MAKPTLPHDHGSHTLELLEHKPTLDTFEKVSNTFSTNQ